MRAASLLLASATGISCAGIQADLRPWPVATRAVGAGLEVSWRALEHAQPDATAQEAEQWQRTIAMLAPGARRCRLGWELLERYGTRALDALLTAPFAAEGIEAQVAALAELHRALLASGAAVNDPLGDALAADAARRMRAAHDALGAFAAAQDALTLLAAEVALAHREHAADLAAAAADAGRSGVDALAALRKEAADRAGALAALESELRMEAAGAGRARPDAAALAAEQRTTLDALRTRIATEQSRRAVPIAALERHRARVERSAVAAIEWAIAHREAARAAHERRPTADFSLIAASAVELGPR